MTKAEEQALKAYPVSSLTNDTNAPKRKYFTDGYALAEQDLMDKAKQWFTDNIPSEKLQLWWCDFEQFITEN